MTLFLSEPLILSKGLQCGFCSYYRCSDTIREMDGSDEYKSQSPWCWLSVPGLILPAAFLFISSLVFLLNLDGRHSVRSNRLPGFQEGDDRNGKLCLNVLSVSICTRVHFTSSVIDISTFFPKLFFFFFSPSEKWHLPTTCKTCLYVIFGSRIHAYSLPSVYHPTPCDLCSAAVWMRSASCHLLVQPRWRSKRECGARQEAAILVAGTITYSATSKHHPALHHHRAGTWSAWT